MLVRICPMCDSEMSRKHYCDACHTWIWKPQMMDIHYNSKARGKNEIDCAYGDEHDAFHHAVPDRDRFFQERFGDQYDERREDETSRKARVKSGRQAQRERAERQREKISQQRQLQTERRREKAGTSQKSSGRMGIIIFVIVIIYVVVGYLMSILEVL